MDGRWGVGDVRRRTYGASYRTDGRTVGRTPQSRAFPPSLLVVSRLSSALVAVALELRSAATRRGPQAGRSRSRGLDATRCAAARWHQRPRRCSALRGRRALWRSRALQRRARGGLTLPCLRGVARGRLRQRRGVAPSSSFPVTWTSQGRREACRASLAWRMKRLRRARRAAAAQGGALWPAHGPRCRCLLPTIDEASLQPPEWPWPWPTGAESEALQLTCAPPPGRARAPRRRMSSRNSNTSDTSSSSERLARTLGAGDGLDSSPDSTLPHVSIRCDAPRFACAEDAMPRSSCRR